MTRLIVEMPRDFVPERTWIAATFCDEFLGAEHEIVWREAPGFVTIRLADGRGAVTWPDRLFGRPEAGWPDNLDHPRAPLPRVELVPAAARAVGAATMPILFGDVATPVPGAGGALPMDVFGTAFYLLSRLEELRGSDRDAHDRFPATAALAVADGWVERPLVDELAALVRSALVAQAPECLPWRRLFRLLPSHDVDEPFRYALSGPAAVLRRAAADALKRRAPGEALRTLRGGFAAAGGATGDPYDTFDWLMDQSERHGLMSSFFFMGSERGPHDPQHEPSHPLMKARVAMVRARGHEAGFHPGYRSVDDPARWRHERDRLLAAWGEPIDCGRQHYLRFRVPGTWRQWADAGMRYDSTLGFADRAGFRCGTAREYPVFDVVARRALALRERPLVVMEVSLLAANYMALDHAAAVDHALALKGVCRFHGGDFTLLWHNSRLTTAADREAYAAVLAG